MKKDLLIGIDAGTSVIKSVAFDLTGNQLAIASSPNDYHLTDDGGAEQDLNATWDKTAETLRQLAEQLDQLPERVAAIAVTGQGDGTWLIDAAGAPTHPALLWLDARAATIVEQIAARPDDRKRFEITGTGLNACQQGSQLLWLRDNRPQALAGSAHAMHCKDWLYYKLTDEIATDPSEANFSFGDYRSREYSTDVLEILGLQSQKHLLPDIVDGTQTTAALSASAASQCGLLTGTPVALGYVDVICTALGSGLYDRDGNPGCTILGSTGMHMRLARNANDVALNDEGTGYTMCMPIPGACAQMQSNMAATLNIDWLLDAASELLNNLGVDKSRADLLPLLESWVASSPPGQLLYQPYISEAGERGPFIDASARAGFSGLSTRHGFNDMARAIFEGLSFAALDCYTAMGSVPDEIRLCGGAARSDQLRGILASTLQCRVRTSSRSEAGAAGAAMMAAVALGHYNNMDECIDQWVTPTLGEATLADSELASIYRSLFPSYVKTRNAMRPIWQSMSDHRDTLLQTSDKDL